MLCQWAIPFTSFKYFLHDEDAVILEATPGPVIMSTAEQKELKEKLYSFHFYKH